MATQLQKALQGGDFESDTDDHDEVCSNLETREESSDSEEEQKLIRLLKASKLLKV